MSNPSLVIVLLEDDRQKMLVYRYLTKRGLNGHGITIKKSGGGSAEQWVRRQFSREVVAYRNRQARAKSALIVVVDADTHTVEQRLQQLEQVLEDARQQAIGASEHVARLVPKRNVETWILCLNEHSVNEATDYKRASHDWNTLIPTAAEVLHEWAQSDAELPNHCIDSLRRGVRELKRLSF